MIEEHAIQLAKDYAAVWGVPWRRILKTEKNGTWWIFFPEWFEFTIDTGDGEAFISIQSRTATVWQFEYYPTDLQKFLVPLWAAFPTYSSITSGWRQGAGERYKHRWHSFYRGLSQDAKAEYQREYPAPTDEERCWQGFYDEIADKPATGKNPIIDFLIGRVP